MYKMVNELYSRTENVIRINGEFSRKFVSTKGVMQGNNLSPTIFNMYINGLLKEIQESNLGIRLESCPNEVINVLAYADDIVLLAETESDLQKLIDIVHEWGLKWRISVNHAKTKIIHFRKKNVVQTQKCFYIGDKMLEIVDSYKYLGIWIQCNLDASLTMNNLVQAGSRALSQIIGKTKNNYDLGYKTYSKLFDTMVCPILDYGCAAWNTGLDCKKLDQVQFRAVRYYCGVPRSTPLSGLEGKIGWTPGIVRRDLECI